uniref:Uncharacterized protein n=1 Tax=viral metagenome TaxID=1070528 RepID=A0A6C0LMM3_9ZZZZ
MSDDNDSKINTGSNVGNFILTTLILIVIIIIYFVISGLTLFGCKAAVSGILPTNPDIYPYTNTGTVIKGQILSNIFTTYTDPPLSEKISFYPKGDDTKQTFGLIDYLRKLNTDKNASNLTKYFVDILVSVVSLDYWLINKSFGFLNDAPEILIILFGPIILHILSILMILVNYIYLMFLWFYKMTWFFKKSTNGANAEESGTSKNIKEGILLGFIDIIMGALFGTNKTGETKSGSAGEYVDTPVGIFYALLLASVFSILFIILLVVGWGFAPVVLSLYCLFSTFSLKTEINDKKSSGFTVVYNLFRFYKSIIMGIISFVFVSSTFSFLGNTFGVAALIVLLLIIFFGMGISIFKTEKIDGLTIALESKPSTSGGGNRINKIIQSGGDSKEFIKQINKLTKKLKTNN